MAATPTRLIELVLIRYREDHDSSYIYFWIEKFNNEQVSDVYECEEDALNWYKNISERVDDESKHWTLQKLDRPISDS